MEYATQVLRTHPRKPAQSLEECLKACFDCAAACTACADACLHETPDMVGRLVKCIDLDLACADICGAPGRLIAWAGGRRPGGDAGAAASLHRGVPGLRGRVPEAREHA